jgi:ribosomal protein L37E
MSVDPSLQPATGTVRCKCCSEPVHENDQFCQHCGFPLRAPKLQQEDFIYQRSYQKMYANKLQQKAGKAAITFYIIAGLTFIVGLVYFFRHLQSDDSSVVLILDTIIAIIFLCLGVWSNKKPVPAIICGLVLYGLLLILQVISGVFSGIIIQILVIAGLLRALTSALEAERIKKQHNF